MIDLPKRHLTTPHQIFLPFEIASQIVEEFVSQWDDLDPGCRSPSRTELLRLRLVSRTWSKAIIPFAFHTLRLHRLHRVKVNPRNWSNLIHNGLPYPVKRLMIQDLTGMEEDESNETRLVEEGLKFAAFMKEVAGVIEFIGPGLTELKLLYDHPFGISSTLISAVKHIKHLKKLKIQGGHCNPKSLADLLVAIPNLESLTIDYDNLEGLALEAPALSNLRVFTFDSHYSLNGIAHICATAKETLKVIEFKFNTIPEINFDEAGQVFGPIRGTLEGLIASYRRLPEDVTNMDFPKLRFLYNRYTSYFDEGFLTWKMFRAIRTLALDIDYGPYYLEKYLWHAGERPFCTTPNLKHIIFILDWAPYGPNCVPPELVEALESHRIQCHIMPGMKPDEFLSVDYELNGPME